MMKDFFGNQLNVGDTVVFATNCYLHLAEAQIDHFGEKMVVLNVYGAQLLPKEDAGRYDRAICRYPEDCVKVEEDND